MKKIFCIFALFLGLLNATPVYKFGISPDYPPFDSLTEGKVSGFDAELLDNVAKIAGFDYVFVPMNFDGLIAGLKTGKIDAIISAMSASKERRKFCDFSDIYYKARTVYIANKGSEFKTKDELKGKKVGAQLGTVQENAIRQLGAIVDANENPTILVLALKDKKLDALAFDALVGREFLAKNPTLVEFYSEDDGTDGFSIAFSKGKNTELREKINKALEEFKQTPEYKALLEKYNIQ